VTTLPHELDRPGAYGGFWIRLVALLLDGLVLLPVVFFVNLPSGGRATVITSGVAALVIVWGYSIGLTAHWGCTLGKAALGLRVVRPDGFRIGWGRALRRDSVFLALGLVSLILDVWQSTPAAFSDRPRGIVTVSAAADDSSMQWGATVVVAYVVAYWLWLVVDSLFLIVSKRKRAAHDIIGGTVVVRRSVAEQAN
jgi:uncharacterized RDD family membrane protein YckC